MTTELLDRVSQRLLAEQDHPREAFFLDRPHESLNVGCQIGRPRRQSEWFNTGLLQQAPK